MITLKTFDWKKKCWFDHEFKTIIDKKKEKKKKKKRKKTKKKNEKKNEADLIIDSKSRIDEKCEIDLIIDLKFSFDDEMLIWSLIQNYRIVEKKNDVIVDQ